MEFIPKVRALLVPLVISGFGAVATTGAAAEPTCTATIVNPQDGATTSTTPSIEVKPDTGGGCNPNWRTIEIAIRDTGSENVIYQYEDDLGPSRAYSAVAPPYSHTVPDGELREGQRYLISVTLDRPQPLAFLSPGANFDPAHIGAALAEITTRGSGRQASGDQMDAPGWGGSGRFVSVEPDTDRPGSDYRDFDLSSADPDRCADACEDDGRCEAYTYVPPGQQGPSARCWLKDSVPGPRSGDGMVSGVKGSPIPQNFNVDRPGSDYRNFDLGAAEPSRCARACAEDGSCSAYTYVPPGRQGHSARCWLKDSVPRASFAEGLVSGTK